MQKLFRKRQIGTKRIRGCLSEEVNGEFRETSNVKREFRETSNVKREKAHAVILRASKNAKVNGEFRETSNVKREKAHACDSECSEESHSEW